MARVCASVHFPECDTLLLMSLSPSRDHALGTSHPPPRRDAAALPLKEGGSATGGSDAVRRFPRSCKANWRLISGHSIEKIPRTACDPWRLPAFWASQKEDFVPRSNSEVRGN